MRIFIAMQVQYSYNSSTNVWTFAYYSPRTHAFRYGRQNENPSYDKRIELTTSSAFSLLTDYQVQAGVQVTNYLDRAINKKKYNFSY